MITSEKPCTHALRILLEDHELFRENFKKFENTSGQKRRKIFEDTLERLVIHATLEEELIYPLIEDKAPDMVKEGIEEHHAANLLIEELKNMTMEDKRCETKFHVLSEMIEHHLDEEEEDTFEAFEKLEIDFEELGIKMDKRKRELMKEISGIKEMEVHRAES